MTFLRALLWVILASIAYVFAMVSAIFAELEDSVDAVMCWLENRQ